MDSRGRGALQAHYRAVLALSLFASLVSGTVVVAPPPPPQCGNGVAELGEQCDGADMRNASCSTLGFPGGGTLSCNNGTGGLGAIGRCTEKCCFDVSSCNSNLKVAAGNCVDRIFRKKQSSARLDCPQVKALNALAEFTCPGNVTTFTTRRGLDRCSSFIVTCSSLQGRVLWENLWEFGCRTIEVYNLAEDNYLDADDLPHLREIRSECWSLLQRFEGNDPDPLLKAGVLGCSPWDGCTFSYKRLNDIGKTEYSLIVVYRGLVRRGEFEIEGDCAKHVGWTIFALSTLLVIGFLQIIRVLPCFPRESTKPFFPSSDAYRVGLPPNYQKVAIMPLSSLRAWATPKLAATDSILSMLAVPEPTLWDHLKRSHPMLSVFYATSLDPFNQTERLAACWAVVGLNGWVLFVSPSLPAYFSSFIALASNSILIKPILLAMGWDPFDPDAKKEIFNSNSIKSLLKRRGEQIITIYGSLWLFFWAFYSFWVAFPPSETVRIGHNEVQNWLVSTWVSFGLAFIISGALFLFRRRFCGVQEHPSWYKEYSDKAKPKPLVFKEGMLIEQDNNPDLKTHWKNLSDKMPLFRMVNLMAGPTGKAVGSGARGAIKKFKLPGKQAQPEPQPEPEPEREEDEGPSQAERERARRRKSTVGNTSREMNEKLKKFCLCQKVVENRPSEEERKKKLSSTTNQLVAFMAIAFLFLVVHIGIGYVVITYMDVNPMVRIVALSQMIKSALYIIIPCIGIKLLTVGQFGSIVGSSCYFWCNIFLVALDSISMIDIFVSVMDILALIVGFLRVRKEEDKDQVIEGLDAAAAILFFGMFIFITAGLMFGIVGAMSFLHCLAKERLALLYASQSETAYHEPETPSHKDPELGGADPTPEVAADPTPAPTTPPTPGEGAE